MIRNTLAVLSGLAISLVLILIGITLDKHWFDELSHVDLEQKGDVILYWRSVLAQAPDGFFIALLISFGVASMIGGVVTAMMVLSAKQAYAMFIGFILLIVALIDLFLVHGHPLWYKISLVFVFFPFAWLGGKIVDVLTEKNQSK